MALSWKDFVKVAVTTGGTGNLVVGSASSGYQGFAAGDDAKLFPYSIIDGTAWETGFGTYTHSGTTFARTVRQASSTGSALNVTTSAFVIIDNNSKSANYSLAGAIGAPPGGRLTFTTGVPVTTADVTAAGDVYYTPYLSNIICLWDGNTWAPTEFTEVNTSIAGGGSVADRGFDVFGYLTSGALTIERTAWTSGTARATAITLQDGRYCKSGDKTRLYLGSYYTVTSNTSEDSINNRMLFNMYNRVHRRMYITDAPTAFSYSTNTWRAFNNYSYASNDTKFCNFFAGLVEDSAHVDSYILADGDHFSGAWINGAVGVIDDRPRGTPTYRTYFMGEVFLPQLGLNSITAAQYGNGDANSWRAMSVTTEAVL